MTLENANNLFSEREDIQEKIGFDLDGFLLLKIPQSSWTENLCKQKMIFVWRNKWFGSRVCWGCHTTFWIECRSLNEEITPILFKLLSRNKDIM